MRKCLSASPFKAGSCPLALNMHVACQFFCENLSERQKIYCHDVDCGVSMPFPGWDLPNFYDYRSKVARHRSMLSVINRVKHVI
jgi:hypothetical protein